MNYNLKRHSEINSEWQAQPLERCNMTVKHKNNYNEYDALLWWYAVWITDLNYPSVYTEKMLNPVHAEAQQYF